MLIGRGKGRPMSVAFEQYVRGVLATGCSASAARGTVARSAKTSQKVGRSWRLSYPWNVGFDPKGRGLVLKLGPTQ